MDSGTVRERECQRVSQRQRARRPSSIAISCRLRLSKEVCLIISLRKNGLGGQNAELANSDKSWLSGRIVICCNIY